MQSAHNLIRVRNSKTRKDLVMQYVDNFICGGSLEALSFFSGSLPSHPRPLVDAQYVDCTAVDVLIGLLLRVSAVNALCGDGDSLAGTYPRANNVITLSQLSNIDWLPIVSVESVVLVVRCGRALGDGPELNIWPNPNVKCSKKSQRKL